MSTTKKTTQRRLNAYKVVTPTKEEVSSLRKEYMIKRRAVDKLRDVHTASAERSLSAARRRMWKDPILKRMGLEEQILQCRCDIARCELELSKLANKGSVIREKPIVVKVRKPTNKN